MTAAEIVASIREALAKAEAEFEAFPNSDTWIWFEFWRRKLDQYEKALAEEQKV